jgi:multiple sugar transport system permease protein
MPAVTTRAEGLGHGRASGPREAAGRWRRRGGPGHGGAPGFLASPALLLLGIFYIAPLALVGVLALFTYDPLTGAISFAGLANFHGALAQPELRQALVNTLIYVAITVPGTTVLGLVIALAIHAARRGAALWRTLYMLPVATTMAAMSIVWTWMFYPRQGPIDRVLQPLFGLHDWLDSTTLALPAVAIVGTWAGVGISVILFLAGLSAVPPGLHDVARLDRAGRWQRFWHVTWPALGPATVFTLVYQTSSALRAFDTVRVMTNGGPGTSSQTLALLIWQRAIEDNDIGGGAVVSLVLLLLMLAVAAVQLRAGRRLQAGGTR